MNERECRILVKQRCVAYDPGLHSLVDLMPCEFCGTWSALEAHHRKFRSRGGLWTPANVILLCAWHHQETTDEKWPESGLNVGTWEDPTLVPVKVWYAEEMVLLDNEGGFTLAA